MRKNKKNCKSKPCPFEACEGTVSEPDVIIDIIVTDSAEEANVKKEKKPLSAGERIYNLLDTAEKIATIIADSRKKKKKKTKKQLKKDKKIAKVNKKTGALVLKKIKKDKVQKPMKRYKPPKEK